MSSFKLASKMATVDVCNNSPLHMQSIWEMFQNISCMGSCVNGNRDWNTGKYVPTPGPSELSGTRLVQLCCEWKPQHCRESHVNGYVHLTLDTFTWSERTYHKTLLTTDFNLQHFILDLHLGQRSLIAGPRSGSGSRRHPIRTWTYNQ